MKEIFERILALKEAENLSKETIALFLMEEAGEVATAVNVEAGHKGRVLTESGAFECADVIINAIRLMVEYHIDYEDLKKMISKKLNKWEKKVGKS